MNCIAASQNKFEELIAIMIFASMQFAFTNISLSFNEADSAYFRLPELTVTAGKKLSMPEMNYTGNTIIDKSKIEAINPITWDELFRLSPTAVIKDYGGMVGMKTISLRGSLAAQTLITLNGTRINSSQNGIIDLTSLPIALLSEIQIVRGGLSAIHGSSALGGVVNIITDRKLSGVKLTPNIGSYGDKVVSLAGALVENNYNVSTFFEYKASDGSYPINVSQYGDRYTYKRENADFKILSFGANAQYYASTKDIFHLNFISTFTEKGVPGAVLQGNLESLTARSNDMYSLLKFDYFKVMSSKSSFKTSLHYRYSENHYVDKVYVPINYAGDSHFYSNDFNVTNHFDFSLKDFHFRLSNELFYSMLTGDMLDKSLGGIVSRYGASFSVSADTRQIFDKFDFFIASRIDFFNKHESSVSPYLGFNYSVFEGILEFPASISYNFRIPSFNELYYLNYGNSNLKPEKSISFNVGMNFLPVSNLSAKVNLFMIQTQDLILSVPKTPLLWSAQNVGIAQSCGFEFEAGGSFWEDELNLSIAYTRMDVRDKELNSPNYNKLLPYFPQETIGIFILFKLYDFNFIQKLNYNSFTYSLRSNDINSVVAPYSTFDVAVSKVFKFGSFTLYPRFDIINLFDERFAIIKNYPMPGRMFRFSVNVIYGEMTK